MLLAIDVGNTNASACIFKGKKLTARFNFLKDFKKYSGKFDEVIIVSVAPKRLKKVLSLLKKTYKGPISQVGKDIKVPLRSGYNPKQIGQDRLVTAYAASVIYGRPILIIDFGTAVTFDVVSETSKYLGGLIFPGIKMSLESLHNKTALLPEVELEKPRGFIGKDTQTSIRNGLIFGYSHVCEGMISRFTKEFKNLKVVATGGNVPLMAKYACHIETIDPLLSLKGLYLLAKLN